MSLTLLGLSESARKEWETLRTCRLRCHHCGAEIQACKSAAYCKCDDPFKRIGIGGTIYCEDRAVGPHSSYEEMER